MINLYLSFFFALGTIVGSFLNVCIYRLPRGESIIRPRSHCPGCGHTLGFFELIPLLSYLWQKGKCRQCGAVINFRYFLVELISGFLFAFLYFYFLKNTPVTNIPGIISAISYFILACLLVIIAFIDFAHKIIPDKITYPGMAMGLIFSLVISLVKGNFFLVKGNFFSALVGLLLGAGIFLLIIFISRGGMGAGDVKLAGLLGAFLGWPYLLLSVFFSFLLGGAVASLLLLLKIKKRKDYIPFGPYLVLAAFIVIFWGDKILLWYWR